MVMGSKYHLLHWAGMSAYPVLQRDKETNLHPALLELALDSENPVGPFQLRLFFDEGS